jgi:predicted exporter
LPSRARQAENARLIDERLSGAPLEALRRAIGPAAGASAAAERDRSLAFEDLPAEARAGLATFRLGEADRNGTLVVVGGGWTREETARVVAGLPGVRLVDPAREISALFAAQRRGALAVVGASLAAILAIAAFRFGGRAALRVIAPPVAAVLLAPLVSAALFGPGFTFFDAMALALVAALGADYALFWAEAAEGRRPVALLSIALASATTLLAFGLLAFSSVRAVAAFGSTVFVGIVLAALFAPLARGRAR